MRDFRIVFNGPYGNTYIDLDKDVHDKAVTSQKVLINLPTIKGTDHLYPERGTDLLKQCIGAVIVNKNAAQHIANFAALDTIYFINDTDGLDVEDPNGLADVDLTLTGYDSETQSVSFDAVVYFPDGTSTQDKGNLNFNN